jgi:hypothetical protein
MIEAVSCLSTSALVSEGMKYPKLRMVNLWSVRWKVVVSLALLLLNRNRKLAKLKTAMKSNNRE